MANTKKTVSAPNKISRLSKDDAGKIIFWRIIIILVADLLVASAFDYLIHSPAEIEFNFYMNIRPVLCYVFWALFALSVAYMVISIVKKFDTSAHIMTPAMIAALTLYLAVMTTGFFYDMFKMTPYLFYTVTVIASVLFVVYYVYTVLMYKK
ncbi:MAG: hypothetical protein E7628_02660 [Ruminococcaceae bacterium]|nr:hypothetical protein [Oscillospiraceae bacterium]